MVNEQIKLFGEDEKPITAEQIEEMKEKERLDKLCVKCGVNEKSWHIDSEKRDWCSECVKKYYQSQFEKLDLPNGFREGKDEYYFYSSTTGLEKVEKTKVLAVIDNMFDDENFPKCIQTCDEYNCFKNCFGITLEFAKFLIKELELVKESSSHTTAFKSDNTTEEIDYYSYINKKIIPNENAKKIAEKRKQIGRKREELMGMVNEIKELEKC